MNESRVSRLSSRGSVLKIRAQFLAVRSLRRAALSILRIAGVTGFFESAVTFSSPRSAEFLQHIFMWC
jgi:hypothetical protein